MALEPENNLLTRAANGEKDAFRELFEAHHAAMFRFAYRLTGAVDAAEDITQECFLRLVRSPRFDRERGSLRQYLYGIVRNLVRQRQQASGREVCWDDDAESGLVIMRKLVWVSAPGHGRFLLSLTPYAGYPFQKAGVVNGSGLSFSWNGDHYEWRSRESITESSGNWNLYVLAAPTMAGPHTRGFSFGGVNSVEEFLSKGQ